MLKRNTKTLVYLFILIICFLFLFLPRVVTVPFKFSVVNLTYWPIQVISFPFKELKKMLFYHRTYDDYMRLKKEFNILRGRLVGLDELLLENSRLAQLLQFKRKLVFSSLAANIIGRDPSNWNESIIIDRGSEDGIVIGMAVVNASGVVGKIVEVGDKKSKVILISDPSFSVAALVKNSREVGLVSGTLEGKCRMRYLSAEAVVQKDDEIITSKLSSSFPEGLLIGKVIEVTSSESSPTINCIIEPSVSLSQIEEVLVILNTD